MKENYNKDCHSFNIQMAKEIGLVETLILKHLYYWCYANSDNQDMIKNGYIWVYITRKKIEETYPYLKDGKIRGAIEKLKKDGYILINCFNKLAIDKTNWYALTDKAYKEFGTSLAKLTNGRLKSPSDSQNNQAIQSIEKEYNNNKESTNVDKKDEIDFDLVLSKWSEYCPMLSKPRMIDNKRKKMIVSLLKNNEATIDDMFKCFKIMANSQVCNGDGGTWKASFDWFIKNTNSCFNGLLEGKYSFKGNDNVKYKKIMDGEDMNTDNTTTENNVIEINGKIYK